MFLQSSFALLPQTQNTFGLRLWPSIQKKFLLNSVWLCSACTHGPRTNDSEQALPGKQPDAHPASGLTTSTNCIPQLLHIASIIIPDLYGKAVARSVAGAVCRVGSQDLEEQATNGTNGSEEEAAGVVGGSEEHLLTGHSGAVVCAAMHEDRLLFTGSTDCTIKVQTLLYSQLHQPSQLAGILTML